MVWCHVMESKTSHIDRNTEIMHTGYKRIFNNPWLIFCYYYWNKSIHFKSLKNLRIFSMKTLGCGILFLRNYVRASLVVQWLRIHLTMQGTWVRALVWEDPTCCGATKLVYHNYWACTLEPVSHNYWSLCATTTEAHAPRARAPQEEKSLQWEACAPQWRVAPTCHN